MTNPNLRRLEANFPQYSIRRYRRHRIQFLIARHPPEPPHPLCIALGSVAVGIVLSGLGIEISMKENNGAGFFLGATGAYLIFNGVFAFSKAILACGFPAPHQTAQVISFDASEPLLSIHLNFPHVNENYPDNDAAYNSLQKRVDEFETTFDKNDPIKLQKLNFIKNKMKTFAEKYQCIFSLGILRAPVRVKTEINRSIFFHLFSHDELKEWMSIQGRVNPINKLPMLSVYNTFLVDENIQREIKYTLENIEKDFINL